MDVYMIAVAVRARIVRGGVRGVYRVMAGTAAAILRVALEMGSLPRLFSGRIRVRGSLGSLADVRKEWKQGDVAEGYAVAGCRQFF